MVHSLDLLDKALTVKKAARWCDSLNITKGAISQAKKRGRLSPTLAANIAIDMGADPIFWAAIAAAEAEPEGPLKDRMVQSLERHKTKTLRQTFERLVHSMSYGHKRLSVSVAQQVVMHASPAY